MKKTVLLAIIFIIPIAGVLVFNFFSKSHFNIPVYYQEEAPDKSTCPEIIPPYSLSKDIMIGNFSAFDKSGIKIIGFTDSTENYRTQINRVADAYFDIKGSSIYSIGPADSLKIPIPFANNIEVVNLNRPSIQQLKDCVFLFDKQDENDAVLIDFENRIRGYYNLNIKEEADSLIIEGKILIREKDL